MHSVLEQRKQWQKQYISVGKLDRFVLQKYGASYVESTSNEAVIKQFLHWFNAMFILVQRQTKSLKKKITS